MRVWVLLVCLASGGALLAQTVSVGPNVRVWSNFTAQDETSVATSTTVPGLLVAGWNDYSTPSPNAVGAGFGWSADAGATWTRGYLSNPQPTIFDGQGDPALAAGPGGIFYYSSIAFNYSQSYGKSGLYTHTSTNGGQSWTSHEIVYSPTGDFHDKEYVTVDPTNGNVYVAWTKLTSSGSIQLLYSYSTNQGTTWSSAKTIVNNGVYPDLIVDNTGALWVAYMVFNNPPTNGNVKIHKITNPATASPTMTQFQVASFTEIGTGGKINADGIRCTSVPSLDYNRTTGKFALVWPSKVSSNYDGIYFAYSSNGTSWSSAGRIDNGTSKDRYFPWVAFAPNGNLCVVFYDNRNDVNNKLIDVYATLSYDQGLSWTPNIKITELPSDPKLQFSGGFFGDYIGVIADSNNRFHPVWTDARAPGMEQDIWTATIYVTPPLKVCATLTQYDPSPVGYPMTLELWKNGVSVYTQAITLGTGGCQTVNLPVGMYDFDTVSLVGQRFLRLKVPYAAGSQHNLALVNGDVDGSNGVDLFDLNHVLGEFSLFGEPSDLNGNNQTDINDLTIVLLNFLTFGD